MEEDSPLKQWEEGVSLGSAWWAYADLPKKRRFRELQQAASPSDPTPHMGFRAALEAEAVDRLSCGELQAFGVEYGSTGQPIAIPRNYFWKGAEIDLDNDTVTALGRKFGQVTVQGKREQIVESVPEMPTVDLGEILAGLKLSPVPELLDDSDVMQEAEMAAGPPRADAPPKKNSRRGRPSREDEIERAIDFLLRKGVTLTKMPRPEAYEKLRECARELGSDTAIGFTDPVIQRVLFRRFGPRR